MVNVFKKTILVSALGLIGAPVFAGILTDSLTDSAPADASNGRIWIDSNNGENVLVTSDTSIQLNAQSDDYGYNRNASSILLEASIGDAEGFANIRSAGNTNVIVDDNEDGEGAFTVFDRNAAVNGIETINSSAQSTVIKAGTATADGSGNPAITSILSINDGSISMNSTGVTSINTNGGAGNVQVGNSGNTTNLNSLTNNIGLNGNAANTIWSPTNTYTNNLGTGTGKTVNNIGNANAASQVNAQAGNAKMTLVNNSASLTVPTASATENTQNGFAASGTAATMTGGDTSPTRLTMNDDAATFSRASNGAPITVTGVADGKADFDAINVRQFANAIAGVAAMANIPAPEAGKNTVVGVAVGGFMSKSALALGVNHRFASNVTFKASLASGLNKGAKPMMGAGLGWSW